MSKYLADVYKKGTLAGHFSRTDHGATEYIYAKEYIESNGKPISSTLPIRHEGYIHENGALPPFFTGLLPEGRRLTGLRRHLKISADDELSMLMEVGSDTVGDVQVVPLGTAPDQLIVPDARETIQENNFRDTTFADFFNQQSIVDPVSIPGVQDKVSGKMLTIPLSSNEDFYFLKVSPPEYPHLVENEAFFLKKAQHLQAVPGVVSHQLVHDATGRSGLLIRRFDRYVDKHGVAHRLAVEDACQLSNHYPADKYHLTAEQCARAILQQVFSPRLTAPEIFRMFVYAWLTGNGDLHAKNLSVVENYKGQYELSPLYDAPSTAPYGDKNMALLLGGKRDGLSRRKFLDFSQELGVPSKLAERIIDETLARTEQIVHEVREELPFDSHRMKEFTKILKYRRLSLLP